MDQSERDLLIEIKTKVDMWPELWQQQFMDPFQRHLAENAKAQDRLKASISAAHKRVDGLITIKNRFMGGVALLTFLVSMIGGLVIIVRNVQGGP